jgi:hypothetical protein
MVHRKFVLIQTEYGGVPPAPWRMMTDKEKGSQFLICHAGFFAIRGDDALQARRQEQNPGG